MFFRSKRKIAAQAAVTALRPMVALAQQAGGMSLAMWRDPYLLGYMGFVASFFGGAETKGKATPEAMGFALQDAFSIVSNMNGKSIVRQYTELALHEDVDFESGADDAAAVTFYSLGILKNEADHPLVVKCGAKAELFKKIMEVDEVRPAMSAALMQETFIARVKTMQGTPNA